LAYTTTKLLKKHRTSNIQKNKIKSTKPPIFASPML